MNLRKNGMSNSSPRNQFNISAVAGFWDFLFWSWLISSVYPRKYRYEKPTWSWVVILKIPTQFRFFLPPSSGWVSLQITPKPALISHRNTPLRESFGPALEHVPSFLPFLAGKGVHRVTRGTAGLIQISPAARYTVLNLSPHWSLDPWSPIHNAHCLKFMIFTSDLWSLFHREQVYLWWR